MLRHLGNRCARLGMRSISTSIAHLEEGVPAPAGVPEFTAEWTKKAPSQLNMPELPSGFLPPEKTAEQLVDGEKFPVNFYTPNGVLSSTQLEQVVLPGVEGYFGVKANHVPTIAQLKPGVVELHDGNDVQKYFVSGGFAFVHPNSVTDVVAVEAASLDQFDAASVKTALQAATAAQGTDDYENAVNRAAQELYTALDAALESKG